MPTNFEPSKHGLEESTPSHPLSISEGVSSQHSLYLSRLFEFEDEDSQLGEQILTP